MDYVFAIISFTMFIYMGLISVGKVKIGMQATVRDDVIDSKSKYLFAFFSLCSLAMFIEKIIKIISE